MSLLIIIILIKWEDVMKRTLFYLFLSLIGSFGLAITTTQAQSTTQSFALSLGNAFKNHADMPKNKGLQALATSYGGEDVANKPLPTLRAIA
jgi:hypothetical protein